MKYILLLTTMILTVSLYAQRGGERGKRGEKIEQQRIAFITTELDLSVEEAHTFWPIYNNYQAAKKEIGQDRNTEKNIDDLTEDEAKAMLSNTMETKRRLVDLEYEFMNKIETVLPAKKRLKLVRAERNFKKTVLNRYKRRMKRGEKMAKKEKHKIEKAEEKDRN